MRLASFILADIEPILLEWEAFARRIWPGAAADPAILRDHAEEMLRVAVSDMQTDQTPLQRSEKSKGKDLQSERAGLNRASEEHGAG